MNRWPLICLCLVSVLGCAAKKSGGTTVLTHLQNQSSALKFIDDAIQQNNDFQTIQCLDPQQGHLAVTQHCYASKREPEDLLAALSQRLSVHAKQKMGWRQDFGIWTSDYTVSADQSYALVLSMIAKGLQPELDQDQRLKKYRTYLWLSFGADTERK